MFPTALNAIGLGIPSIEAKHLIDTYISTYEELCKNEGDVQAQKLLKACYGIAQRYAVGHRSDSILFRKCDESGFPLMVIAFKPYLGAGIERTRDALCILQLFKLKEVENLDYDINNIITVGTSTSYESKSHLAGRYFLHIGNNKPHLKLISKRVALAWKETLEEMFPIAEQSKRIQEVSSMNDIHLSSKNGPNGPCIGNSWGDYIALRNSESLYRTLRRVCKLLGNELLNGLLDAYDNAYEQSSFSKEGFFHSRLRLKQEAGAKVRVFAIGDYFSQCALTGLHNYIFRWLSSQPEDGTHRQDEVAEVVKEWTLKGVPIESEDLTAATDRIPAKGVLREIATQMVGKEIADEWINLLINRDFNDPKGNIVRYMVGQPMGVKTSWALLAVWHHAIFRTALKLNGKQRDPKNLSFVIIGDDSANHKYLGEAYRLLVVDFCEVSISETKGFCDGTYVPELNPLVQERLNVAEIAKRVFVSGHEITPISPVLIQKGMEMPMGLGDLLYDAERRGYFNSKPPEVCVLANLGYKPKRAIQLASFPLWPAPVKGYWQSEEWQESKWFKDLSWNLIPLQTIELFTKSFLAGEVESAVNNSLMQLTELIDSLDERELSSDQYENFRSGPQCDLFRHIYMILRERVMFRTFEAPGLAGDRKEFTRIQSPVLRESARSLQVINDWRDLVAETKDKRLEKLPKESAILKNIYQKIQKLVNPALPSF